MQAFQFTFQLSNYQPEYEILWACLSTTNPKAGEPIDNVSIILNKIDFTYSVFVHSKFMVSFPCIIHSWHLTILGSVLLLMINIVIDNIVKCYCRITCLQLNGSTVTLRMLWKPPCNKAHTKGWFTWYDFVACNKFTTGLQHWLFCVNQTYNLLKMSCMSKKLS